MPSTLASLCYKPKADILNICRDYQFVFSVLDELYASHHAGSLCSFYEKLILGGQTNKPTDRQMPWEEVVLSCTLSTTGVVLRVHTSMNYDVLLSQGRVRTKVRWTFFIHE